MKVNENPILMTGKHLNHYQVTGLIGKGGMGEVYQAKDQKLGRDVAIKVLPDEFARDADRVARFQREAKLLASLNHPNIAAIYGLEESGGTNFLVMELVEGSTLADLIKTGPIPVEEALKLALQIAEALEAAHEKGVIHRDLKPANIKVTPEEKVKVLDFGLAKAFSEDQGEAKPQDSPTLSAAATRQGVILGTAAYMSPEQARGKTIDRRTDIWAFGCVLYEMLTGQAAFQGEDISEILASVIKGDSNLALLPENIHTKIREVIIRSLQKDLRKRYADIADARYEIEQVLADPGGVFAQSQALAERQSKRRPVLPWVAAALVLGAVIAGLTVWKLKPTEPRRIMRFEYDLPEGQQFSNITSGGNIDISRDGRQFAYSTPKGLYIRSMNELSAKLIPGTEGGTLNPFFSPDAKWIGYQSLMDMKLKKIAVAGGSPVDLCDVTPELVGAVWGSDDMITYCQLTKGIMQISANGGMPQPLLKKMGPLHMDPRLLPDGKYVMFTEGLTKDYKIKVQSLESGKEKELFAGLIARYLPTGYIVYASGTFQGPYNLFAVPFNLDKLETTGGPVPLINNILNYAVSDSGTLIYIPGTASASASAQRTLVWLDRRGKEVPIAVEPNDYSDLAISPDGTKIALTIGSGLKADIWILDILRQTMTRLTFNESSFSPLWSPDGKRIAYEVRSKQLTFAVYWKAADGTGEEKRLSPELDQARLIPSSWSGDGKTLVLREFTFSGEMQYDIDVLPLEGDRKLRTLLKEKYGLFYPKISPDGRWMAYQSAESGQNEIYVRPFPDVDNGKWQISTNGGVDPLWSPDGRELFYVAGTVPDSAMAVAVQTEPTFKPGKAEPLFQGLGKYIDWDISNDGKSFLFIKAPQQDSSAGGSPRKIIIVTNWFEELKKKVPGD